MHITIARRVRVRMWLAVLLIKMAAALLNAEIEITYSYKTMEEDIEVKERPKGDP